MSGKIIVIGSSNTDMILKMKRIPKRGETIIGGDFFMASGGKGANQAVAAARAGAEVILIAKLGIDTFGDKAIDGFQQDGIDVQHIIRDDSAPSGVAFIFVDENGENSIGVASGANAKLSSEDILKKEDLIAGAELLILQLETPLETVKTAARTASLNCVPVILNPAPAQALDDELLKYVSILTPNETEAEILTGISAKDSETLKKIAANLRSKGIENVLITLGPRGVYVDSTKFKGIVPGFEIKAVDTTAAGDVFNGALAVALSEKKSMVDAVKFACAAAALACCAIGAQISAPWRKSIEQFLKDHN